MDTSATKRFYYRLPVYNKRYSVHSNKKSSRGTIGIFKNKNRNPQSQLKLMNVTVFVLILHRLNVSDTECMYMLKTNFIERGQDKICFEMCTAKSKSQNLYDFWLQRILRYLKCGSVYALQIY